MIPSLLKCHMKIGSTFPQTSFHRIFCPVRPAVSSICIQQIRINERSTTFGTVKCLQALGLIWFIYANDRICFSGAWLDGWNPVTSTSSISLHKWEKMKLAVPAFILFPLPHLAFFPFWEDDGGKQILNEADLGMNSSVF